MIRDKWQFDLLHLYKAHKNARHKKILSRETREENSNDLDDGNISLADNPVPADGKRVGAGTKVYEPSAGDCARYNVRFDGNIYSIDKV
jgi:hypothetical protein